MNITISFPNISTICINTYFVVNGEDYSNKFVRFIKEDNLREMNALFISQDIFRYYLESTGKDLGQAEEILLHGLAAGCLKNRIRVYNMSFKFSFGIKKLLLVDNLINADKDS